MVYVPICKYNSEQDGITIQKYNDKFCEPKAFQPTFNEYGMCFTYNNRKQGMDEYFRLHHSIDEGENFSDSNANTVMDNEEDLDIVKVCFDVIKHHCLSNIFNIHMKIGRYIKN